MDDDPQGLTWSGLLSLGLVSAVMLVVGFALGWWLDQLLNTFPILVLVGIGLGIVASVSFTYVRIRSFLRE
ncbi:MAG TPA: AtpZ/AtpI family protein [Jatrophihabitans sp.]|nr:AtpZ/AtpI family protein [Jatrophihabitans sp.]